jgi:carbonic anhydrase/acetyltransferase-like protein (isoleucine patch superfamily)
MLLPFDDKRQGVSPRSFVAPDAALIGDVEIGEGSSIWFGAVLRGDINWCASLPKRTS